MASRVLFVDDDRLSLKSLRRVLRNEPYQIVTFDSPLAALRKIVQIRPAVVISDQIMPGMTGTEFLKEVMRLLPDCVRMVMTGFGDLETALAAINQGHVFRFIQKPWEAELLKAEIEAALQYHEWIAETQSPRNQAARREVIDKERLAGVRELAAAMRYELGQPLAIIHGYTQLLKAQFEEDSVSYAFVANIIEQIDRMKALMAKLTTVVRYKTCECPDRETIFDIDKSTDDC